MTANVESLYMAVPVVNLYHCAAGWSASFAGCGTPGRHVLPSGPSISRMPRSAKLARSLSAEAKSLAALAAALLLMLSAMSPSVKPDLHARLQVRTSVQAEVMTGHTGSRAVKRFRCTHLISAAARKSCKSSLESSASSPITLNEDLMALCRALILSRRPFAFLPCMPSSHW